MAVGLELTNERYEKSKRQSLVDKTHVLTKSVDVSVSVSSVKIETLKHAHRFSVLPLSVEVKKYRGALISLAHMYKMRRWGIDAP